MEHEKGPSEIEDLIIEYALIALEDETVCELIRQQDEICEDDPNAASEIEGNLDAKVYSFLKKRKQSARLVRQLKMSRLLVRRIHSGDLVQVDSAEARAFIRQDFKSFSSYWGTM